MLCKVEDLDKSTEHRCKSSGCFLNEALMIGHSIKAGEYTQSKEPGSNTACGATIQE